MRGFKELLREPEGPRVTDSIFEAGYGSLSRVYEKTDGWLPRLRWGRFGTVYGMDGGPESIFCRSCARPSSAGPRPVNSYREVAEAIGQPKGAREVARACASNSVAIVIPCHRVIRGTGELGGYRWGLARKSTLLAAER